MTCIHVYACIQYTYIIHIYYRDTALPLLLLIFIDDNSILISTSPVKLSGKLEIVLFLKNAMSYFFIFRFRIEIDVKRSEQVAIF